MNLLNETIRALVESGHAVEDVTWVGSTGWGWCDWSDFATAAEDIEYSEGYGGQEIAKDLVIVGEGWWLERGEYDGSEWWDYKTLPVRGDPGAYRVMTRDDIIGELPWAELGHTSYE